MAGSSSRGAWGAGLGLAIVGALTLGAGCSAPSAGRLPDTAGDQRDAMPPWDVTYSDEQEALLAPLTTPVQVPARRVFPDIMRFGYADDRPLEEPADSFRFTRLIARVLEQSPRMYSLDHASPELANERVQYGPPAPGEPDPWAVVRRGPDGIGILERVDVPGDAMASYERGQQALQAGDPEGAVAAFREAVERGPDVPALPFALAEALAAQGDEEAITWFERVIQIDPTFASAHRALAAMLLERGNIDRARTELMLALAYHPASTEARTLADSFVPAGIGDELRPDPFAIFLDVDAVGAVRVFTEAGSEAQMYGGCRAVMRFEPELRAAILEQPPQTPYYLTVTEEVICLESAIGAYLFDQTHAEVDGAEPVENERMEALLRIARREGLSGYVMFEILGRHRPERARTAPPRVHRAAVDYVDRYVLGHPKDLPPGHYTARLGASFSGPSAARGPWR